MLSVFNKPTLCFSTIVSSLRMKSPSIFCITHREGYLMLISVAPSLSETKRPYCTQALKCRYTRDFLVA